MGSKKIKNNKRTKINVPVIVIFICFFILLLLQHQYAWFSHDDFGYGSLSYAFDGQISGHSFSLIQLFNYLKGHYLVWGGRVLCFAVNCLLCGLGVGAWRIVQSVVITLIFFCIYLLIARRASMEKWKIALLVVSTYGLIGIMTFRNGVFWASASTSYIFPLLPFFIFINLYELREEKKRTLLYKIALAILLFVTTFSYEQISIMALTYIVWNSIAQYRKTKKIDRLNLVLLGCALAGFLLLMLAPGNYIRMQHPTSAEFYSLPILERLQTGLNNILDVFFSPNNSLFLLIFITAAVYSSIKNIQVQNNGKKIIKILNYVSLMSNIVLVIFSFCFMQSGGYYSTLISLRSSSVWKITIIVGVLLQCLLALYAFFMFGLQQKKETYLCLVVAALLSLCVMTIAPYFPARALLPFEITMFVVIVDAYTALFCENGIRKINIYLILPLCFLALYNYAIITIGYRGNNYANQYNHQTLTDVSNEIKNGEQIDKITLLKVKNQLYGGDQPYNDGNDYILIWIKKYYDLPENIIIEYREEVQE